ncbi:MAG: response regulator [Chloroflexota bacterium]
MPGLLIADDTDIIRSTIARVVIRENLGLTPVVEASNGEEAVELARQIKPDIVLIDIRMPGLDGLQAADIIHTEFPSTKIIILTAYDEFPYVQKALKLGVVDYLVKPVRPARLAEMLAQVYAQVQAERRQWQTIAEARDYLQKTMPMVENSLIERLVHRLAADAVELEETLAHLGKKIFWPAVLVVDIINFETPAARVQTPALPQTLIDLTRQTLNQPDSCLVGYMPPGRVIAIISTDYNLATADRLRQLGAVLQQTIEVKLGLATSIGLGHRYESLDSVSLSYAEASLASRHRLCQSEQTIIHIDDIHTINCRETLAYPVQLERDLLDGVRLGEKPACAGLLNEMLDYLLYQFKGTPIVIRNRLAELIALVARLVIEAGAPAMDVLDLSHDQVMRLSELQDVAEIRAWALNNLTELMAMRPAPAGPAEDPVQQALAYIRQHYQNPEITLNEVAGAVSLSSSHLAYRLKETVGMSYKSYLTSLRIEQAKILLRTTNLPVTAIAQTVGYQNSTNFYRLFQRETGLTPAGYRRS